MYREFLPPHHLKPWVVCYWVSCTAGSGTFRPVYPDGCADIIFNFGGGIVNRVHDQQYTNCSRAFAVGTMTRPLFTRPENAIELLGVRFQPGALFSFTRISQREISDRHYPLTADFPDTARLHEQLWGLPLAGRIGLLNKWLTEMLAGSQPDDRKIKFLRQALDGGQNEPHATKVSQLAREAGYSVRQMERMFLEYVGVSPKEYLLIARFINVKNRLAEVQSESLLEVAVACGFHDHAHLTHVFKKYAGATPSEYLRAHL